MDVLTYQILRCILSVLAFGCIGRLGTRFYRRLGDARAILKVLMQMGVLLALLLVTDRGSLGMRGAQVGLPARF